MTIGVSTGVVILQILFRHTYCYDFLGSASLSQKQNKTPFDSVHLCPLAPIIFPLSSLQLRCEDYVVGASPGDEYPTVSCSLPCPFMDFSNGLCLPLKGAYLFF